MNGFGHRDVRGCGLVDSKRNMSSIEASKANNVAADDVRRDGIPTCSAGVVHFDTAVIRNQVVRETNDNAVSNDVDIDEWVRRPAVGGDEIASRERHDRSGERRLTDQRHRTGDATEDGKVEPSAEHRGHDGDRCGAPTTVCRGALAL